MALTLQESDRQRLDGIVQKMINNKETDADIRWVVNDFKQKYGKESSPAGPLAKKEPGFVQSAVQTMAKPFLRAAVSAAGPLAASAQLVRGGAQKLAGNYSATKEAFDSAGSLSDAKKEWDFGYFGKVKPVSIPVVEFDEQGKARTATAAEFGKGMKDAVGAGAELATSIAPAGQVKNAASIAKVGFKQSLKQAVKEGASLAAASATGSKLQDESATVGDALWEVLKAAPLGAAISTLPVANAAVKKGTEKAQKSAAERIVNSLIKPRTKEFAYGKNPGRAITELGITGGNFEELGSKADDALSRTIGEINDLAEKSGKTFTVENPLSPLDEALREANKAPRTNAAVISRIENIKKDLLGVTTNDAGDEVATRTFKNMTGKDALESKRFIGSLTKFTGNDSDDKLVNASLKKVYGKFDNALENPLTGIPGLAKLNQRASDLIGAVNAISNREAIVARSALHNLQDQLGGAVLGVIGALTTGGLGALAGYGVGAYAQHKLSDPGTLSKIAAWLAKRPNYEKKALLHTYPMLRNVMIRSLTGNKDANPEGNE